MYKKSIVRVFTMLNPAVCMIHYVMYMYQFLQKKSETSSEDISVRAVCLDGSLSAPRSRTWRTCFYLSLFISQPDQNIRAWGKKIIKLEAQAEVRLGMNVFLFCLPLAVPSSTFRPKLPPELGQRSGIYSPFYCFPSNCSSHRLGPDTCCSLLELNAVG